MTPVFHLWSAWHMGGRGATTLPILKASNGPVPRDHIQDSTRILLWLAAEYGLGALLPTERSLSDQVSAIEDRFDVIGHHVNRVIYAQALQHDEQVLRFWNSSATPQQDRWLRLAFPLIKWGCMRRMRLQADAVRQSQHRLQQTLAWLDGRLSDGRRYLVGGQLSLADISVASILAPLACPSEHPVYGQADFKRYMLPPSATWLEDRPSLLWVRRTYAEHRSAQTGKAVIAA